MQVLVTGGTGLVGSHVIAQLVARHLKVRALVRNDHAAREVRALGAEPVAGDVRDRRAVIEAARGVDGIVHAAALVTSRAPLEAFEAVNVAGTLAAVEAAAAAGARLVHLSSTAVYGRLAGANRYGPVNEAFPFARLARHDFYARTKRAAEDALFRRSRALGVHATALRPCVIYGERDRHFSPRIAAAFRHALAPRLGSGRNVLACVYAGNVAAAVLNALEAEIPAGGAYNVTNDGALTLGEFARRFCEGLNREPVFVPVPRGVAVVGATAITALLRTLRPGRYAGPGAGAIRFLTADNPYTSERAVRELAWSPPTEPPEAVWRTGRWFREAP